MTGTKECLDLLSHYITPHLSVQITNDQQQKRIIKSSRDFQKEMEIFRKNFKKNESDEKNK